jgi:hypothetical protein
MYSVSRKASSPFTDVMFQSYQFPPPAMASHQSTLYQPLDPTGGIRILILEPRLKGPQILCRLILENIYRSPDYKALSYEWGSADDSKAIVLNGRVVSIRQNLWWALWHLRGDELEMRLWIDALCINQEDAIERGHQVSMMGSIYRNAEVICWLGRGDGNGNLTRAMRHLIQMAQEKRHQPSEKALRAIDKAVSRSQTVAKPNDLGATLTSSDLENLYLYQLIKEHEGEAYPLPPRKRHDPLSFPKTGTSSMSYRSQLYYESHTNKFPASLYRDVEALCSLSYWRRTWIIQEVVLGKRIQIRLGDNSIDGDDFASASRVFLLAGLNEESLLMVDALRILSLRSSWLKHQNLTLIRLIEFSERSSCQDLRDRVYAMIGLASDCQDKQIVPDYNKSLLDVFSEVVLGHFYPEDCDQHGYSWQLVHSSQLVQRAFWSLSGSLFEHEMLLLKPESFGEVSEPPMLKIFGVNCGTVCGISDPKPGTIWWAYPGLIKSFLPETSQSVHEASRSHTWASPIFKIFESIWSPVLEFWYGSSSRSQNIEQPSEKAPPWILRISTVPWMHAYGPSSTQPGDIICRFINSDVVAVLRPVPIPYILVGRAMILNSHEDVSIFHEGLEELPLMVESDLHPRNRLMLPAREIIRLEITPAELQSLTSPHY